MKSINQVLLLGSVGKDAVIRSTPSGMLIASFSLATSDRKKDSSGNWVEQTEWHNITAFGKLAEVVRDYVSKGSRLLIQGKINNQSWEKDGQKHYKTVVLVNDLTLLDGKKEARQEPKPSIPAEVEDIDEDSIPF